MEVDARLATAESSAGATFLRKTQSDPNQRNLEIDYSIFRETGVIEYKPFQGYETEGIKVTKHESVDKQTLELQRGIRFGAAVGSIGLFLWSSIELLSNSFKLVLNTIGFGNGSEEEAYEGLGKAYTKSSIAGVMTGVAHESSMWAVGNGLMGLFSKMGLDKLENLAGFIFADGLSSIGMGQVRFKEKQNAFVAKNSIFNDASLSPLRFLMPVEQAIRSFGRRFTSIKGWKSFLENEPYELFNSAGGGLVCAGTVLGGASLFKNFMSDTLKNFFYIPAALTSVVNLVALYRDGDIQVDRAKLIGGKKKIETYLQGSEGYLKKIASPFLALNNLLFGLKGIGMDSNGSIYNLAMGMRSIGAAFAFLGFSSQAGAKFPKPESFGPRSKEIIEIEMNPISLARETRNLMEYLDTDQAKEKYKKTNSMDVVFREVIAKDTYGDILNELIQTDLFQALYGRHQAGLPVPGNEKTYSRYYLDRGNHSTSVCGVAIKLIEALKKNTSGELLSKLEEEELPLRISCLIHDLGHGPFSHVLDKAIPGQDNDERTLNLIRDPSSEIHKTILRACEKKGLDGNEVIKKVLLINGKWDWAYKLLSGWGADRIEYERFSDFPLVNNGRILFPRWSLQDLERYSDTFRLYEDNGEIKVGYTKEGALLAFLMCSDRQIFDVLINSNPKASTIDLLASVLGKYSPEEILTKTEKEVRDIIFTENEKLTNVDYTVLAKVMTGSRMGYSYYSRIKSDPTSIWIVNEDGSATEFLDYLDSTGIENYLNEISQNRNVFPSGIPISAQELQSRIKAATTPKERYIKTRIRTL